MNVDKRKKYIMVLDTETCNAIAVDGKKLDLTQSLVYDVGFQVIDKKGNIYEQFSAAVREIFCGERDLMKSAYYCKKIPQYWEQIWAGERLILSLLEIRSIVYQVCEKYGITTISAHNARFDVRALNNTIRYVTKSKYRYFLPYNVEIWDSMGMAADVVAKTPTYRAFCEDNGLLCKNGQVRKTAEALYRYISNDNTFNEKHTGLEDVKIESIIVVYCLAKHKAMPHKVLYSRKAA